MRQARLLIIEVDEVIINHGYDQDAELLKKSKMSIDIADDFYVKGTSRGNHLLLEFMQQGISSNIPAK